MSKIIADLSQLHADIEGLINAEFTEERLKLSFNEPLGLLYHLGLDIGVIGCLPASDTGDQIVSLGLIGETELGTSTFLTFGGERIRVHD